MCGFAGMLDRSRPDDEAGATLRRMANVLRHRGPDDEGVWWDAGAGVGFAHRRLSILDLTEAGHQPMESASGRFAIAYNGEIYNFAEIRKEIGEDAIAWRGHCDTEVLLAAIERWGLDGALARCAGMFAFALWDRREHTLSLVRDRMGVKPVYVARIPGGVVFGSELKALRVHPDHAADVDRDSLALFMRYRYVPTPASIYRDTWKVEPGQILEIGPDDAVQPDRWRRRHYWSVEEAARAGREDPLAVGDDTALELVENAVAEAVRCRLVSDVPLGALLSGGIDSSAVVAFMCEQATEPVRTYTIGFAEREFDEAEDARAIAAHLGTVHTERYISPDDAMAVIPSLPELYDEPFADGSQIPTFLVSRLAREEVSVGLSGDGGDELFGGYVRHVLGERIWSRVRKVPRGARRTSAALMRSVSPSAWEGLYRVARPFLPELAQQRLVADKLQKLAMMLDTAGPGDVYDRLVSACDDPAALVVEGRERASRYAGVFTGSDEPGVFTAEMMLADMLTYLPDDILTKVDRASMGVSLEARNPFLDHRLIELGWRLPLDLKIREGTGKWILRQLLYRRVPHELLERPKMGFAVPIDRWLRGPLREWAESLLEPARLRGEGYLDPDPIARLWREHLDEKADRTAVLWNVLMFQQWLEHSPRLSTGV